MKMKSPARRRSYWLFAALMLIASCRPGSDSKAPAADTAAGTNQVPAFDTPRAAAPANAAVTCKEQEIRSENTEDPEIIRTCTYGAYSSESDGQTDYKGRYSWYYKLYRVSGGRKEEVKNGVLFRNQERLLAIIRERIMKDYNDFSTDPETKDCFEGAEEPVITLDGLGLEFKPEGIEFSQQFGLPGACMAVDGTGVTLSFAELKDYLNE